MSFYRNVLPILLLLLVFSGCRKDAPEAETASHEAAPAAAHFTDVTEAAGIVHRHAKPNLDPKLENIMAWMASVGAAVAANDYDKDGWIDLYVTSSRKGEPNRLYKNSGASSEGFPVFTDVAGTTGLADVNGDAGVSTDAVWGDYNNDGWSDLYLVRWGRDSLFRSNGDGTFTDVTDELFRRRDGEPGIDWANGNGAVFFDYDRDGRLDIYVGNYFRDVDLWHLTDTHIMHDDFERARNAGSNFLYHQEADGTFTEVAREMDMADTGWTLAVGSGDLNGDGWPDLYSANDFGPDQLFMSRGDGTLENVTKEALGYDTKKGMNVDFGDFDNDGWLDVYITNITTAEYLQEGNMLWLNLGADEEGRVSFVDVSQESGAWDGGWGWGAKFLDFDNDRDLDLISVNGFISGNGESYWYDLASWTVLGKDVTDSRNWPPIEGRSFSGHERTRAWRNDGLYKFTEAAVELGLASDLDGRGISVADLDNDGDLDVYIANQGQPANLYRNDLISSPPGSAAHYLTVALETDPSTSTNRDGIGTRVTAVVDGTLIVRERDGGNGFAGQSDPRLHFGFGPATVAELVEVRWPDGGRQYFEDVAADQLFTIHQDPSRYTDREAIEARRPDWKPPEKEVEPRPPEIAPEELERQLSEMESRLLDKYDRRLASTYRRRAADYGKHDRAIDFLQRLVEERGSEDDRLELAVAYVDKIPTCGGLAAIVCKGSLAKKGLDQADAVIARDPDSWLAYYVRGMNHLHWPRGLRHSEDAARDLERCVEIQAAGKTRPFHVRAWVALGEAWAKAGQYEKARETWRRGLELFPDSSEIAEPLAIDDDDDLLAFVVEKRSLEHRADTDLSFFTE